METLDELVRFARAKYGLSLREAEEKTGISNAYLSQIENGKIIDPKIGTLKKLALGFPLYETEFLLLFGIKGTFVSNPQPRRNRDDR